MAHDIDDENSEAALLTPSKISDIQLYQYFSGQVFRTGLQKEFELLVIEILHI